MEGHALSCPNDLDRNAHGPDGAGPSTMSTSNQPAEALRICIVSTFYPPYNFGGDGIYAHRLANGLARRGHQVTVLHSPTAYTMLAGREPTDDYRDHANVRVRPVPTPLGKVG